MEVIVNTHRESLDVTPIKVLWTWHFDALAKLLVTELQVLINL